MSDFCPHCRILRLSEDGLLDKWKKVYWPLIKQCDIKSSHKILTLADVQGLFYLVSGSLLLAFAVLMIENRTRTWTKGFRNWIFWFQRN